MVDSSKFEVTGHYELPERGAFVLGHFCGGGMRPGDAVRSATNSEKHYFIAGVESISGNGSHSSALVFRGAPGTAEIAIAFPIGAVICAAPSMPAGTT